MTETTITRPAVFTVKQAAAELRISPSLVYGLLKRMRIRHERFGIGRGTIRIPAEALDEYRRGCAVGSERVPVVSPAPAPRPQPVLKHLSPS